MKRVLEVFRGIRNLSLSNDEAFGIKAKGKAPRRRGGETSRLEQKTMDLYRYTAVTSHRDVNGKRQYRVLWADASLSWEPAESFTLCATHSEGPNNVVAVYEQELVKQQKREKATARRGRHRGVDTYRYSGIRAHCDDVTGARSTYEVVWSDDTTSWEPVSTFTEDVERCEGTEDNVILAYEKSVLQAARDERAKEAARVPSVSSAKEFATWVEQTQALEMSPADRARADERLANLPRVPSLLPWSVRSPLTTAAGRMKMHDYLLYGKYWAPLHLRGFFKGDVYRILVNYFTFLSRLTARSIRPSEVAELKVVAGVVLSELELVLPVTEFTILVHVLLHIPAQLSWFGPANTTWMFSFERFCFEAF